MKVGSYTSSNSAFDAAVGLHQILPCQYFDQSGADRLSSEQRLMLALLADAINVYQQGVMSRSTRKRLLYIDAERWITADGANRHAFSFANVCESLGIDPSALRRRMIAWKHEVRRGIEARSTQHLRLKITPRSRRLSQRRRRAPATSRAF